MADRRSRFKRHVGTTAGVVNIVEVVLLARWGLRRGASTGSHNLAVGDGGVGGSSAGLSCPARRRSRLVGETFDLQRVCSTMQVLTQGSLIQASPPALQHAGVRTEAGVGADPAQHFWRFLLSPAATLLTLQASPVRSGTHHRATFH